MKLTMKAVIRDSYGSPEVLKYKEIEKPIPKDNEILIKVHSASVNHADSHGLRGTPFIARIILGGLIKPKVKILGYDFAGQVESVGIEACSIKAQGYGKTMISNKKKPKTTNFCQFWQTYQNKSFTTFLTVLLIVFDCFH